MDFFAKICFFIIYFLEWKDHGGVSQIHLTQWAYFDTSQVG